MNESDAAANATVVDSLMNYETVKYFNNEKHEFLYNCKNTCNNKVFDVISGDNWTYSDNNIITNPINDVYTSINAINRTILQPQTFDDAGNVISGDASFDQYKLSNDSVFDSVSLSLDDKTKCEYLPIFDNSIERN